MEEAAMGADASHLYSPAAMPIYEYRCENGHLFEVMQKITDDPVTACPEDGSPVQRVFHPVAVHFKGSGFYNTDYGTAKRNREMDRSASSGADKHDAEQADKRESKSSSDGGSSSSSSSSTSSDSSGSSGSGSSSGSSSS
jgi:putative FmdB family regulatory protein